MKQSWRRYEVESFKVISRELEVKTTPQTLLHMNNQYYLLLILSLFYCSVVSAQADYFQQEVNYKIEVSLNDKEHELHGNIQIEYHNNAPNELDTLYFHLWPNAYRNNLTAFAKQMERRGEGAFLFAEAKDKGWIDSIDFKMNNEVVRWQLHHEHSDIAILLLAQPINAGDKAIISTPFRVKLPYCFSRLGHVDQSYQITQWFPKPAVYDQNGWHPMPYLDMGEFYSEFGSFDVSITLPQNYLVAATGVLQNEEELSWLMEKESKTIAHLDALERGAQHNLEFPPSSQDRKTLRYKAEQIHDFAWFADKRFMVLKDQVELAEGQTVDCWAFFTEQEQELWKDAPAYIKRTLVFYSDLVGRYPYPQATAVQTALGTGGGMEYPMVTNCGLVRNAQSLDGLIAHEVGHNWFYGILGSNERDHPWMDEGLNSYYDHRYSSTYYDGPDLSIVPGFLFNGSAIHPYRLAYLYQARRHLDQAPDTHSDEMGEINYFLGAYEKPAEILQYLEAYLGTEQYDRAMQVYYQQWKFKHPQPNDFRKSLEATLGQPLDWLFEELLYSNAKQNYAIKDVMLATSDMKVKVVNKGNVSGPFALSAMQGDSVIQEKWYEGFEGEKVLDFPSGEYTEIVLDRESYTFDIRRQDNQFKLDRAFSKMQPPRISFFTAVEDDTRANLYWMPLGAWNNYDKFMPGLLFYNTSIPEQRLEWRVAPLFGLGSKRLTGLGDLHYNIYPENPGIRKVTLGLNGRSFHYRMYEAEDELLRYNRWQPYLDIHFGVDQARNLFRKLSFRNIWIQEEQLEFTPDGAFIGTDFTDNHIQELRYTSTRRQSVNGGSLSIALEHQSYEAFEDEKSYVKMSASWTRDFHYGERNALQLRFFAGAFLHNTERDAGYIAPGAFNLISQGYNDYRYDGLYLGRTENDGMLSQQISTRDGGFKTPIGTGFNLGRSNNYVIALNLKAGLPPKVLPWLPVKPYFDIAYFDNAMPTGEGASFQDQLLWSGGVAIDAFNGAFAIYFPIINSDNLGDRLAERGNYVKRIGFQLNLQELNPWTIVDELSF